MAFGSTAVLLSDFTGANEDPLSEGGHWSKVNLDSGANMTRNANRASNNQVSPAFGDCNFYWTVENFGPDVDVYYTVSAKNQALDILLRLDNVGTHSQHDGYWLQIVGVAWGLFYVEAGASHLIQSVNQAVAVGNKIGLGVACSTLTAYLNTGGGWAVVNTVNDTQFDRVGPIAIGCAQNLDAIDDVFAGTVPRTSPCTQNHWLPILGVGT